MAGAGDFMAKDGELRGVPRAGDLFSLHRGAVTFGRAEQELVDQVMAIAEDACQSDGGAASDSQPDDAHE